MCPRRELAFKGTDELAYGASAVKERLPCFAEPFLNQSGTCIDERRLVERRPYG